MAYAKTVTTDTTIKTEKGVVYAILASADGVTSGDTILVKDDTTTLIEVLFGATDTNVSFCPSVGIRFNTSIKVEVANNGDSAVTIVYE